MSQASSSTQTASPADGTEARRVSPADVALVSEFNARDRSEAARPAFAVAPSSTPQHIVLSQGDRDPVVNHAAFLSAMGTVDDGFADLMLRHLLNALGDAGAQADAAAMNGALAALAGIAPRDEAEGMLAVQMVAVHVATMTAARRLKGVTHLPQMEANGNLLTKLGRTYAAQLEALKRYRTGGQQKVTVEHVTVNAGGQAIVGAVAGGDRGVG